MTGDNERPSKTVFFANLCVKKKFNPPPNFGGLILKILNVFLQLKFLIYLDLDEKI